MTVSSLRIRWLAVFTVLAIAVVLGACNDSPAPTPEPTVVPNATPTLEPTATETPTPTPTLTPMSVPTATLTATPALIPTATATPTPTSSPTPPATPTAEELAAIHLSAIIPWFSNPPADHHSAAADMITRVWLQNASLGDAIAALPWVVDGLSSEDFGFLTRLLDFAQMADIEPRLVKAVFNSALGGDLSMHLISSLRDARAQNLETFNKLLTLPWVADGLSEEEAAFLVPLAKISGPSLWKQSHRELRQNYYVQSKAASLPLAGDIKIWVFSNDPFESTEDWPAVLESSASIMEQFMGRPFPTNNMILLIEVVRGDVVYASAGSNYQHSMWVAEQPKSDLPVVHETAHYYFWGRPNWLSEGGSDFMESYVAAQEGAQSLEVRRAALLDEPNWQNCVSQRGLENLLHLTYHASSSTCAYVMGEHFLLAVLDAIGPEPMGAALSELYRQWPSEQQIYDTFLKHTPPESRTAFLDVYDRLHGGPTLPEIPDDHGDDQASGTPLSVGQTIKGVLDYRFDFDFFSFQAEQGREYLLSVQHDALRPSSLGLYFPGGTHLANDLRRGLKQVASGLEMRWMAPHSDTYFVSVENFAGETGTYTLTVTPE